MDGILKIRVQPPSGTIILNRPEKRNALSRMLMMQLSQAFDDLHQERNVRAVIVTGAGSAFCAGMDLDEMRETASEENPFPTWRHDAVAYKELLEKMLRFPKPIIAAVNGPVAAGGAGLVLACDLAIGCEQGKFGLPEPKRGLVAGIVAPLLYFRLGGSRAAHLLLTGNFIDALAAERFGLYMELAKYDLLWARAHAVCEEIAHCAPESLQLTKRMLNETIGEHLGTLLSAGAAASATARTTEAASEGLAAFLEKRKPKWL